MILRIPYVFAVAAALAFPVLAHAATPAPLPTPNLADYAFTAGGSPANMSFIDAFGVDRNGHVYIGGWFDHVNGVGFPGLARIGADGTLDTTWIPVFGGPLIGGRIVEDAAGRIVTFGGGHIYRIDPVNGAVVQSLAPASCGDTVRTIAVDPVNSDVYAACHFVSASFGSSQPAHVYRFDGTTGAQDLAFDVTLTGSTDCNGGFFGTATTVNVLAHDGAGHLYIGGTFTGPLPAVTRAATPGGQVDTAWTPLAQPPPPPPSAPPDIAKLTCFNFPASNPVVKSIVPAPGNVVYVGGFYAAGSRTHLGRFSALGNGALDLTWTPPATNGTVTALGLDLLRNNLYLGAPFFDSNGVTQALLVVLSTLPGAVRDTTWDPRPDNFLSRLFLDNGNGRVVAGGDFTTFGGAVPRNRAAALPLAGVSVMTNYYQSILGRAPDPSGIGFWSGEIVRLTTKGVSPNEVYMAMANYFFTSPEFAATPLTDAQFIEKLYLTFLARPSDPSGRAYWAAQIASGLTREMVMYAFMFSSEFNAYMSANLPTTFGTILDKAVVVDFYRGALARLPDDAGLAFWSGQFQGAHCSGGDPVGQVYITATGISDTFFNGAEYAATPSSSAQYVSDLYNAFLRRGADATGFNFWVSQLETHTMTRSTVRKAFIDSPEFGARVQAIANSGCVAP